MKNKKGQPCKFGMSCRGYVGTSPCNFGHPEGWSPGSVERETRRDPRNDIQCRFINVPMGCKNLRCQYFHPDRNGLPERGIKRPPPDEEQSPEKRIKFDPNSQDWTETILIPDALAGILLGNRGSTISAVKANCEMIHPGVYVHVAPKSDTSEGNKRKVTIKHKNPSAISMVKDELNAVCQRSSIPFNGFAATYVQASQPEYSTELNRSFSPPRPFPTSPAPEVFADEWFPEENGSQKKWFPEEMVAGRKEDEFGHNRTVLEEQNPFPDHHRRSFEREPHNRRSHEFQNGQGWGGRGERGRSFGEASHQERARAPGEDRNSKTVKDLQLKLARAEQEREAARDEARTLQTETNQLCIQKEDMKLKEDEIRSGMQLKIDAQKKAHNLDIQKMEEDAKKKADQSEKEKQDSKKAFDDLKDDCSSVEKDRDDFENERDDIDEKFINLKDEHKKVLQQLKEAQQVNEDQLATVTYLKSANEKTKSDEERIHVKELRIQELEATVEDFKAKENAQNALLNETSQKHIDIKKKRTQEALAIGKQSKEINRLEAELKKALKQNGELLVTNRELKNSTTQQAENKKELEKIKAECKEREDKLAEATDKMRESFKAEIRKMNQEEGRKKRDATVEKEEERRKKVELENKIAELTKKVSDREKLIAEFNNNLKRETNEKEASIKSLMDNYESLEKKLTEEQVKTKSDKKDIEEMKRQLIEHEQAKDSMERMEKELSDLSETKINLASRLEGAVSELKENQRHLNQAELEMQGKDNRLKEMERAMEGGQGGCRCSDLARKNNQLKRRLKSKDQIVEMRDREIKILRESRADWPDSN